MRTSQLVALLADRLARYGDQKVYLSTGTSSEALLDVSDEPSSCLWLRTFDPADRDA